MFFICPSGFTLGIMVSFHSLKICIRFRDSKLPLGVRFNVVCVLDGLTSVSLNRLQRPPGDHLGIKWKRIK